MEVGNDSAPKVAFAKRVRHVAVICMAYMLLSYLLIGYKPDQLLLCVIFSALYLATASTRKFILGFSIFIVYWMVYDYMKAFPSYRFNMVSIQQLYDFEMSVFGIVHQVGQITPNEYWTLHSAVWLDVLSGLFYLCWIPLPLGFAVYLFYSNREEFIRFSLTFFFVNMVGFIIYYLYPAAPPWYIQQVGLELNIATPSQAAGLLRFDRLFNVAVFQSIYAKGSNVFAAMPSLHAAYPLIVLVYGVRNRLGWANLFFAFVTAGIWFAAVYTSHHYVVDVLAGIGCAAITIVVFDLVLKKSGTAQKWLKSYVRFIS